MTIKTDYILMALNVLSWIVFIGLCLEAGIFIVSTVLTLVLEPAQAARMWKEVDLTAVYDHNQSHFVTLASLIIIATVLKAIMFYVIVKFFYNKNFSLSKPFNETTKRFILNLGYLALGIAFFSSWGTRFVEGLVQQGVRIPNLRFMRLAGSDVWWFMGIVLFVIAFIFKKGIELQNENDLTV
nr:DUF2975 domain-containing protein [uncultured Lacibacter sp.]